MLIEWPQLLSKFMTDEGTVYSSMRILPVTNNAKGQQHEITLKLGLQSTEAFSADTVLFNCFVNFFTICI